MIKKDQKFIIELEKEKNTKLLWGLINILVLRFLIIPIFIGISQLLTIPKINKQIAEIKLG